MHAVLELLKVIADILDRVAFFLKSTGFSFGDIAQIAAFALIFIGYLIVKYVDWHSSKHTSHVESNEYDGELSIRCPATQADIRRANDILRHTFGGKHFVSLGQYRALIERNDHVLTVIIDENNEMVGYYDIFPLVDSFGKQLAKGHATELSMAAECEHDKGAEYNSNYIYIGAIFNTERKRASKRYAISFFMQRHLIMHILDLYPPRPGRKYIALASSDEGIRLLRRYNFSHIQSKKDRKDKSDLFMLESEHISETMHKIRRRFEDLYINTPQFKVPTLSSAIDEEDG
jgi:hypothetical protein